MIVLGALGFGHPEPEGPQDQVLLTRSTCGGLEGPQPLPARSTASQGDGVVDCSELLENTPGADRVERSYSETLEQAYGGHFIDGYGSNGCGAPLADRTFGVGRNGFRGMADEPLPRRQTAPTGDGDNDEDDAY